MDKIFSYGRPMSRKEAISSAINKKYVTVYRDYGRPIKSRKSSRSLELKRRMSNPLKKMIQFTTSEVNIIEVIEETVSSIAKNLDATCRTYIIDADNDEIYCNLKDKQVRFKINNTSTVASKVASNKEYILLNDMSYNAKYPDGIGFADPSIKSVLSVPIVLPDNTCFCIIELYRHGVNDPFSVNDVKLIVVVCGWMGATIHQNNRRVAFKKQEELNSSMIDITKKFITGQISLETLLFDILTFAKMKVKAQKCSVYILDIDETELMAYVYKESLERGKLLRRNLKIPIIDENSIVYRVCKNSSVVNIRDCPSDTGRIVYTSILCVPIIGINQILGAIKFKNKQNSLSFTEEDENICKSFSVYTALALHFSKQTEKMTLKSHSNQVCSDLLKRHMKPCSHDIEDLERRTFLEQYPRNFSEFFWYVPEDEVNLLPQYTLQIILDICGEISLDFEILKRFVLTVRKSYRNRPYHNFEHAFTFTHCMYCMLKRNRNVFSEIESKALIIASICHDLDHRGYTNNFCTLTNHLFAQLYEDSQLEYHHIYVTMMILAKNNMFGSMPETVYKNFCSEIKDAILASNLAFHFKYRAKLMQLHVDNLYEWNRSEHRFLIKAIMVTISDLSGYCKPFSVVRKLTQRVYDEFYHEGDMEKDIGITPLSMMDREKKQIVPEDQFHFISVVVLPCADLLMKFLPNTEELFLYCLDIRDIWRNIINSGEEIVK